MLSTRTSLFGKTSSNSEQEITATKINFNNHRVLLYKSKPNISSEYTEDFESEALFDGSLHNTIFIYPSNRFSIEEGFVASIYRTEDDRQITIKINEAHLSNELMSLFIRRTMCRIQFPVEINNRGESDSMPENRYNPRSSSWKPVTIKRSFVNLKDKVTDFVTHVFQRTRSERLSELKELTKEKSQQTARSAAFFDQHIIPQLIKLNAIKRRLMENLEKFDNIMAENNARLSALHVPTDVLAEKSQLVKTTLNSINWRRHEDIERKTQRCTKYIREMRDEISSTRVKPQSDNAFLKYNLSTLLNEASPSSRNSSFTQLFLKTNESSQFIDNLVKVINNITNTINELLQFVKKKISKPQQSYQSMSSTKTHPSTVEKTELGKETEMDTYHSSRITITV